MSSTKKAPSYKTEFPDFELDVDLPEGFEDNSYHNDAMPNWIDENRNLILWIDYKDKERSEMQGLRFCLCYGDAEQYPMMITLHQCDDYNEILTAIDNLHMVDLTVQQSNVYGFIVPSVRANDEDREFLMETLQDCLREGMGEKGHLWDDEDKILRTRRL